MAAILTLNITKTTENGKSVATNDHPNEQAELHPGDKLVLQCDSSWAPGEGLTEVMFYHSQPDYVNKHQFAKWTPGQASIPGEFAILEVATGNTVTGLQLTDIASPDPGRNPHMFYRATVGGLEMDPEIVNESGSGTGGWKDNSNNTGT